MAELNSLIVNGNSRFNTDAFGVDFYANKFIKNGSSDSYVLLGGGGHKLISDFSTASHTHPVSEITWAGGQNLTPRASANNQEWSIDLTPGSYTGTYWHVWSASKSATILACYTDTRYVSIPVHLYVGDYNNTNYGISTSSIISNNGFVKNGSSDSYVLLGGGGHKQWSESASNSTLVARTSDGYIYANWFNTSSGDMGTTAFSRIYVSNDNFIRYVTLANFGVKLRDSGSLDGRYVLKSGDWMDWNSQLSFKGYNGSTSVFARLGYATTASGQTMHCINTAGHQANGAFYITSNGSTSGNDTGGIAIDNEGVTVFGAGDAGSNFTGVFRVLNEDNVADGPQFLVTKNTGASVKYNFTVGGNLVPATTHYSQIGTGSLYWKNAFIMGYGGSIHVGNFKFYHMWNPASGATQTNYFTSNTNHGYLGLGWDYRMASYGNKLFGVSLKAITVNVSTDSGSTWQDITLNNDTAVNFNVQSRIIGAFTTNGGILTPGKILNNNADSGTNGTAHTNATNGDSIEVIIDFSVENRIGYIDAIGYYLRSYLRACTMTIDVMKTGDTSWTNVHTYTLANTNQVDSYYTCYLGQGYYMNGDSTATSNADNHIRISKIRYRYITTSIGTGNNIRYVSYIGGFFAFGQSSAGISVNNTYQYSSQLSIAMAQRNAPYFINAYHQRIKKAGSSALSKDDTIVGLVTIPGSLSLTEDYYYTDANVDKMIYLYLGNNTSWTNRNVHARGAILIYASTQYYSQILTSNSLTANRTVYLPNGNGWLAVGGNGSNTGVGSASKPVYLSTAGVLTETTYSLLANINAGTANRIAWYSGTNTISSASTIYASNNTLTINGTSVPANSGNFQVIGTSTMRHIYPEANNTYTLGSTSLKWNIIWLYNLRTTNYEVSESTANRLAFGNHGQSVAKGINVGDLLVSGAWADYTLVPTNGIYSKGVIRSGVATGTAPFTIASTTLNTNLNADMLDGYHANYFHIQTARSYTSVDTMSSDSEGWYNIFTLSDSTDGAVICTIKAYAHSSITFIASKGYDTSATLQILQYNSSSNGSYFYVKGVRIVAGGKVQALFNKTSGASTNINVNINIFSSHGTLRPNSTLTLETGTPTVIAGPLNGTHGKITSDIVGNASTATKLATPRAINGTNFDGTANITTANWGTTRTITIGNKGQSVNGSSNVTWTLADILGSTAVGSPAIPIYWTGSAFSTVQATFGNQSYGSHDANIIKSNGLWYYNSNGPTTNHGTSTSDGALYSQAYSTSWVAQIAQDYRNGNLFIRGLNNGTWQPWKAIATADNDYVINPVANIVYNVSNKRFIKVAGENTSWDSELKSKSSYKECKVTYRIGQTNAYIMVGLNSDPNTNVNYNSIDYCWYTQNGGNLSIYENGTSIASIEGHTTYAAGDELIIECSGDSVKYYHNGILCRKVARTYGTAMYLDSSFYTLNGYIYDLVFEPVHNNAIYWTTTIKCATISRICYISCESSITGSSFILNFKGTRNNVVYNDTYLINTLHSSKARISCLNHSGYGSNIDLQVDVNSSGDCYISLKDSAQSATNSTTQSVKCAIYPIRVGSVLPYTSFTDGTTVVSGFTATILSPITDSIIIAQGIMGKFYYYDSGKRSDNYVLLANGGAKAISDFATSGHNHDDKYVTSLSTNGDYLTWTKNGSNNNITIPYATNSTYLKMISNSTDNYQDSAKTSSGNMFAIYALTGTALKASTGDGYVMSFNYGNQYTTQIAVDLDPTYKLAIRNWKKNNSPEWNDWKNILTGNNSYVSSGYGYIDSTEITKVQAADKFTSNATVTLTGDTTGTSAGSTKSWTVPTITKYITGLGRRSTVAAIKLNPSVDTGQRMTWHISDSTSRNNDATNSPSFDAGIINVPWDWGGYNGQIALGNTGTTRMQIRSASHIDNGEGVNPRYTPNYGEWREVVTATKGTQIGNSTTPIYISNTGQVIACSYTISSKINSGTVNRLAYYKGANEISSQDSLIVSTSVTYGSRTLTPVLRVNSILYADSRIEAGDYFLVNKGSAGASFYLYTNNIEYGRLFTNTVGVAGTATTFTNPDDSSQTKTGYTGNVAGQAILALGNNKAVGSNGSSYASPGSAGTANNAAGYLRLYSTGTGYGQLTGFGSWIHADSGLSIPSNKIGIMFRPDNGGYYTHFDYETAGNEALVMATQNTITSFIFVNGESYANVASDRWTKLTGASGAGNAPGLQIKQNCVRIGGLWGSGTNADSKLRVDGVVTIYPNANTTSSTSWTYPSGGYYATANPNIRLIGDNDHGISTIEFISQKKDTSINKSTDCAFIQFNPYGVSAPTAIGTQPTLNTSGEANRLIIGVNNDSTDQLWLQTPGVDGLRHIVGTNNYRILTSQNTYVSSNKGYINGTEITLVTTATKLGSSTVGSDIIPIYLNSGTPTAVSAIDQSLVVFRGKNMSGSVSAVDTCLADKLRTNSLAAFIAENITIERSSDSGSTWTVVNYSDSDKLKLFRTEANINVVASGNATTANQLRITLNAERGINYIYFSHLLIQLSTTGATMKCEVSTAPFSAPTTFTTIVDVPVSGYSGWNSINASIYAGGFSSDTRDFSRYIRFRFYITAVSSSSSNNFTIMSIYGHGGWDALNKNNLSYCGRPYTYNESLRVYFPEYISATGFIKSGSSDSYVLLGGGGHKQWSESASNSTLVARTSDGYIYANWFNTSSGDMGTTAFSRIYVSNDNFIRYVSKANFISGLNAYWANLTVSSTSSDTTVPSFGAIRMNGVSSAGLNYITGTAGRIFFGGNFHIDSLGSNATYINYYTANNVYLVAGSSQGKVGIGTTSPEIKLDVNGIQQIYQRGNDNTAFKDLLLLKQQNSSEASGDSWSVSNPTFGIGFKRYWTSSGNPYGETTCAGIYATVSSSWRGGLVFRTKNNQTQGGTHDVNALRLAPSGYAYFVNSIQSDQHIYSYGFHHRSKDDNNYVLLAGGGYESLSNIYKNMYSGISYEVDKSLQIGIEWINTGIDGSNTNLSTGAYIVSVFVNNHEVGGGNYSETYVGLMSWFNGTTNSTDSEEILLHNSGHAPNDKHIYLRTLRRNNTAGGLLLQIACDNNTTGNSTYKFKFKKLI